MTINSHAAASTQPIESVWLDTSQRLPASAYSDKLFQHSVDLHPALEEVRKMKEFQPPEPNVLDQLLNQPWMKNLTQTVNQWLDQLMHQFAKALSHIRPPGIYHLPESIRDIFSGIIGFMIILLSLYAFYIILGWLLQFREWKKPRTKTELGQFEAEPVIDSAYHSQKAQEAAHNQQYDIALFQLYLASLCILDERAIVPYQASRSNLEYLESLADTAQVNDTKRPQLQTAFQHLSQRFEASRYGQLPVNSEQYNHSQTQYQQIQAMTVTHG